MKKIVSFILCFVMAFSVFTAKAEETLKFTEEQYALLSAIGMYSDDEPLASKITRGEFADMLVKSIFDEPEYLIEGTESFNDVNEDNKYYSSVMILKNLKVTLGDGEGNFNPSDEILTNDAIVMAVRFLGYTKLAEKTGYIPFAAQKGISEDMHYSYDETLSRYNALLLIFNVLNTDVSDRYVDETAISTYLKAYRSTFLIEGIVEDDGFINAYGLSDVAGNEIVINGVVFKNNTDEKNLFGCNVKAYYKENNDKPEIVALVVTKDNNTLSIDAENIKKFSNSEREYIYRVSEEEDFDETVYVPKDITIVYNGVSLGIDDGALSVDEMVPEVGNIILFDNDGDKRFDILYINEYETYIVAAADIDENIIYMKEYKESIALKKGENVILDKEGKEIEIDSIKENSTLSVLKSLSGEIIRIYVSDYFVSDIVVGKNDDKTIVTKNNGAYDLSYSFINQAYEEAVPEDKRKDTDNKLSYALNKIEFTTLYRINIDIFGDVAYIEPQNANIWETAVLISAGNEARGTLGTDYKVVLYGVYGTIEKYNIGEKVNVYFSDNTEDRIKDDAVTAYINNYVAQNKESGNRLVRYKVNLNGELTDLEFPLAIGTELADINTDRMYIIQDSSAEIKYEGNVFQGKAIPSTSCKVINVPTDNLDSEDEYLVSNVSGAFANNGSYKLMAYGTDTKMKVADYFISATGKKANVSTESAFIVSKITQQYDYDKNINIYKLEGFQNATAKTVYVTEENVFKNASVADGTTVEIGIGDVLLYGTYTDSHAREVISKAYVIYDADGKIKNSNKGFFGKKGAIAGASADTLLSGSTYGNPVSLSSSAGNIIFSTAVTAHTNPFNCRIASGYVYSIKDANIMLTTQPLGNGAKYTTIDSSGLYVTEVYGNILNKILYVKINSNGKAEVRKATEKDIKPYTIYGNNCTRVVWFGYWGLDVIYIIDQA